MAATVEETALVRSMRIEEFIEEGGSFKLLCQTSEFCNGGDVEEWLKTHDDGVLPCVTGPHGSSDVQVNHCFREEETILPSLLLSHLFFLSLSLSLSLFARSPLFHMFIIIHHN